MRVRRISFGLHVCASSFVPLACGPSNVHFFNLSINSLELSSYSRAFLSPSCNSFTVTSTLNSVVRRAFPNPTKYNGCEENYRLNFFRGSCFFRPPLTAFPPRPLPLPRPLAPSFRKATNPTLSCGPAPVSPSSGVETGLICGSRYFGTCFICGCTLEGCKGLSWRRYSRSSGLSSK